MRYSRRQFERLVVEAIEEIPQQFRERLRNIAIVIENRPTKAQLKSCEVTEGETMYGFYDGVSLIERGEDGEPVLPDRIVIFQRPLEENCGDEATLRDEIAATIRHEIAHHFGIDDTRLEELGKY